MGVMRTRRMEDNEEHRTATRFTIDRFAAHILEFDLIYVRKRMKKEDV